MTRRRKGKKEEERDGDSNREKGEREVASPRCDERNSCRELPFWLRQSTRPTHAHLYSIVQSKRLSFPGWGDDGG